MISSSLFSPRKLAANLRSSPVTGLTYDSLLEKNIYRLVREKSDKKSFQLTKHIIQLEQFPVKLSLIIIIQEYNNFFASTTLKHSTLLYKHYKTAYQCKKSYRYFFCNLLLKLCLYVCDITAVVFLTVQRSRCS